MPIPTEDARQVEHEIQHITEELRQIQDRLGAIVWQLEQRDRIEQARRKTAT